MKILYFDCFSGVSGDMICASLIDAGVDFSELEKELHKLPLQDFSIRKEIVSKKGISGINFKVLVAEEKQPVRRLPDIEKILAKSDLSSAVKEKSLQVFEILARAEGKIHGQPMNQVHFHEVGGVDSIVDIVGGILCLEMLGVDKVYSSPLPTARGFVNTAHGIIPVPAPATLEVLKSRSVPLYPAHDSIKGELVTPTGAAMLTVLAEDFGDIPAMNLKATGYGAGSKDLPLPNLLRVVIGEIGEDDCLNNDFGEDDACNFLLETNIDDLSPEMYEYAMEKLFEAGALDVFLTNIQMKKNRPALKISVLCQAQKLEALKKTLFRHTSSLGLRVSKVEKAMLARDVSIVDTRWGQIQVKLGILAGEVINYAPEYEDCLRIAREENIPLSEVYKEAEFEYKKCVR